MKKVLVLGAGLVCKPLVRYLLDHQVEVTVATRTVSKAAELIDGHPHGKAVALLASRHQEPRAARPRPRPVRQPASRAAASDCRQMCVAHRKHMVTTSYVEPGHARTRRTGQAGRRHAAQRDRRRPRHRPHVRHAHHRRRQTPRRHGRQLQELLRRPARTRSQQQPVGLQVLLEPARGLHGRQNSAAIARMANWSRYPVPSSLPTGIRSRSSASGSSRPIPTATAWATKNSTDSWASPRCSAEHYGIRVGARR